MFALNGGGNAFWALVFATPLSTCDFSQKTLRSPLGGTNTERTAEPFLGKSQYAVGESSRSVHRGNPSVYWVLKTHACVRQRGKACGMIVDRLDDRQLSSTGSYE